MFADWWPAAAAAALACACSGREPPCQDFRSPCEQLSAAHSYQDAAAVCAQAFARRGDPRDGPTCWRARRCGFT